VAKALGVVRWPRAPISGLALRLQQLVLAEQIVDGLAEQDLPGDARLCRKRSEKRRLLWLEENELLMLLRLAHTSIYMLL
jgi:hypothetical protein